MRDSISKRRIFRSCRLTIGWKAKFNRPSVSSARVLALGKIQAAGLDRQPQSLGIGGFGEVGKGTAELGLINRLVVQDRQFAKADMPHFTGAGRRGSNVAGEVGDHRPEPVFTVQGRFFNLRIILQEGDIEISIRLIRQRPGALGKSLPAQDFD